MPDMLGGVLGREAKRRGLAETRLLTDWAAVVGEAMAGRCQPISLSRNGVLLIDATGAAALELQHAELQVIERINVFFGRPTVARLRIRQAPPARRIMTPPPSDPPPLEPAERRAIDQAVERVEDAGLRAALASLGSALRRSKPANKRR
jgi:hypothetical protein